MPATGGGRTRGRAGFRPLPGADESQSIYGELDARSPINALTTIQKKWRFLLVIGLVVDLLASMARHQNTASSCLCTWSHGLCALNFLEFRNI